MQVVRAYPPSSFQTIQHPALGRKGADTITVSATSDYGLMLTVATYIERYPWGHGVVYLTNLAILGTSSIHLTRQLAAVIRCDSDRKSGRNYGRVDNAVACCRHLWGSATRCTLNQQTRQPVAAVDLSEVTYGSAM